MSPTMSREEVDMELSKLELRFKEVSGNINLLKMADDSSLFDLWRRLRDQQRSLVREAKNARAQLP